MRGPWPRLDSVCSADFSARLLGGLTVADIQTPREQFVHCSPEQRLTEILRSTNEYDYLPVVRDTSSSQDTSPPQVIGVLCTRSVNGREHDGCVGDCYESLAERHLLGADASILEFVLQADDHPCRFVVRGERITGLVTLSDLQRLPVRMTLFALLTGFEMTLIEAIRRHCPEDDEWLSLLPPCFRGKVEQNIERAKARDNFVHGLYATNLYHKLHIARHFPCFDHGDERLAAELRHIRCLRNKVVHADHFALTPEEAREVCRLARNLLALQEQLCSWLEESTQGATGRTC